MRWGVLLPTFDPHRRGGPPQVAQAARAAEALGFDAAWAGDHLQCPAPVLDAPTCLAAAAVVTERIGLGFSVLLLGLRQPAWAAKQLATVDALSCGRLSLGVGVGGEFPDEFALAGVPVAERGARLDAALAGLDELLTGGALEPAMAAPPRLYVGGRGEPALRRAARVGDAWLPMWVSPSTLARRAEALAQLAEAEGRARPDLALLVGVRVDDDAARARAQAEAHFRGQYGLDYDRVARWTLVGDADTVAERLDAYRGVGVTEVVAMPVGDDPLDQYERLAEVRRSMKGVPA
jgi:alkanesulfonate monooxygenase SsuD/methylene tetrahydromethanopterin reductase-like flavin-dependent oxidoreductase (luciferase family)